MAKRNVRPQNPKNDETPGSTPMAEAARPKAKRSRTPANQPTETADDSTIESTAAAGGPTDDDIRERAYQRYLQRGGGHGMDFEDWLEAERELKLKT